ncbi:MAG: NAD(P)H-dependent oxidoreductase, partial [Spirochaetes bacterium]|nr:NAD(P)H-dependent oxidoreductase [Spirochaetota bacterium]
MNIKEQIHQFLLIQQGFFNPKKAPLPKINIQFVFQEEGGTYPFYFNINKNQCLLKEGKTAKPNYTISTTFATWKKIGGGYLSGMEAIKNDQLKIEGRVLGFILFFAKMFSGTTDWPVPENCYVPATYTTKKIKNVLVLSCSPRGKKGVTHLMAERLITGMKEAGANVTTLFPAEMKIKPCIGCFQCWLKDDGNCIYHNQDDLKIFNEYYTQCDLIVWATPIYVYHCSTLLKM